MLQENSQELQPGYQKCSPLVPLGLFIQLFVVKIHKELWNVILDMESKTPSPISYQGSLGKAFNCFHSSVSSYNSFMGTLTTQGPIHA